MSFTTFDQSTWLAHRSIQAEQIGPADDPQQVALPGAKAAIAHDRLLAHQAAGRDQHQIVERVNDRWRSENHDRLVEHHGWAAGPYRRAIDRLAQEAADRAAEDQRRRARLQALLAEEED